MNAIGVDVGGTKIAAAVVSPEGKILNEVRYPTQAVPPNRLIETIARGIAEVKDGFEVGGVCVAVPGLILAAENKVVFAPNLHEIENIRLDEEIGAATGLKVTVENDANAAAWGEFRYGAGKDVEHQVFITLGTGVGGGVITHGMLLRGAQGAGGELGHVTLDPTGPRGGDLEALASGTAIRRRAREVANDQPRSALGRLAVEREVLGEDVTRLAQEGDEASISVLEETGRWLGIGLAGFVNIFNPEVIAVGGGVITHGILLRGAQGAGGELGHVTIDPTGPRCGCGNHGCLEALASGTAIRRRAREVANERPNSALGRLAVQREVLGEDVSRLAGEGDEASLTVLEETGRWLGIGLAGFVNIFNPEVIPVGGGAAQAGEFVLGPAREEVHLRARSPSRDLVRIVEATLGPESGVLGAAALARGEDGEYVLGPSGRVT